MATITMPDIPVCRIEADRYTARRIHYWGNRLKRQLRLSHEDTEDCRQEMYVELCVALRRHDAALSCQRTYINRVLKRFTRKAVRDTLRQRRMPMNQAASLDVGHERMIHDPSQNVLTETQRVDLRLDLEACLQRLAPRLRQVAHLLMEQSPAEAAQALGWNRSSVSKAVMALRKKLIRAGFGPSDLHPR